MNVMQAGATHFRAGISAAVTEIENRSQGMWPHIKNELMDASWHLGCAARAVCAALFGKVTHDGYAKTWRGTSYRIKPIKKGYNRRGDSMLYVLIVGPFIALIASGLWTGHYYVAVYSTLASAFLAHHIKSSVRK